ncbi:Dop1p [Sporobolomyces salmoneus]|uniref:Dop1p n=1 Tax=Sporobolomyces salmoneus TaxID=183962 RepID=UPI00317D2ABE
MPPIASTSAVAPSLSNTTALAEVSSARRSSLGRVKDSFAAMAAQEKALMGDSKYRKYAQAVDKTLQSFDQVNEWADFITFLAKLLKCLQGYPQYSVIPHKLIVAKRLSQCLNPALPTGVHQRALDVYTHILTTIGPENLRRDLPAWSSGLFPFFQYAATSVKPIVLNLYERFYLPLQASLRPATKAFILALLPGVEEETGEFFEKVAELLDRVSGTVSPSFFFQNLWLVLITAPNSRIPALNYLSRRLPKLESDESLAEIVGQDVGLMIRGFAAALEDPQILVQRGTLELMVTTLKMDSAGFQKMRQEDKVLLVRAATGVVLRRDLSLSRRLYTWLLGSSESSEQQVNHLRTHGLELLRLALKSEMDDQSIEMETVERQRPFKIFISLLDKWEIGGVLTEVLVLDAFESLKVNLRPGDDHDELLLTGNMLFEILDPFLLWKQIYLSICSALNETGSVKSIELARFVVGTFRLHDEEVQKLHAPFTAFAILDRVEVVLTSQETSTSDYSTLSSAVTLATELLREIPQSFYAPHSDQLAESPPPHLGASVADALYEAADVKSASLPKVEGRELLAGGIASALRIVERASTLLSGTNDVALKTHILSTITLLDLLLDSASATLDKLRVSWTPDDWFRSLVSGANSTSVSISNFPLHSALVGLALKLTQTRVLEPRSMRNTDQLTTNLATKLLEYLQPGCSPCYVESVQLLWKIDALSETRSLESIISMQLASPAEAERLAAFEAFGNLWRFTEDAQLPGMALRTPMLKMLDSLKAEELSTRRAAEAWMRCSLKSYIRILDPLLFSLLDSTISFRPRTVKVSETRIPILVYERSFDQNRIQHVLDNLLALARFGGQGFIRIAKSSWLKHTLDPALRERVMSSGVDNLTYLDGLTAILLRILQADSDDALTRTLGPTNQHLHAAVAEILQVLVSRGEAEIVSLSSIETALLNRLFRSVHRNELDLQNKLLHVLHSVTHANAGQSRRGSPTAKPNDRESLPSSSDAESNSAQPPDLTHDEFFVRILSDAVSTQHNNAIIHHWVDFLLMTIPLYRHDLHTVLLPLIDRFVDRLRNLVTELKTTYSNLDSPATTLTTTDAEYTALVNALERLVLMALAESSSAGGEDETKSSERVPSETASSSGGGGLLGYMSNVLSHNEMESTELSEETKTKHSVLERVRDAVNLLLYSWDVTAALDVAGGEEQESSQGQYATRAKLRTRRALERIYKNTSPETLDAIVNYWRQSGLGENCRVFDVVNTLAPSPRSVVAMLCDKLNPKLASSAEKNKTPFSPSPEDSFAFLETYLEQLEGSLAVQVWTPFLAFVREVLSNTSTNRSLVFPSLRSFTVLSEKVSQTSALEDRRMRRDLQETFIRLVDASVQLAGRAVESGVWLKRTVGDVPSNGETDSIVSEKTKAESASIATETEKKTFPPVAGNIAREVTVFLSQRVIGDFRRFHVDPDKTVAACSNMVYYIVSPAFKTRAKSFEIDSAIFELLQEMVRATQASKAWRSTIADAFADNRFFNASPATNAQWKPLIRALMAEKERLPDLIGKISTVSSANIFTNRELESLSRTLSLRRLTYALYTGEKDRFLTQLPIIQEKLVDLLRSSVGDMVHAEVYLCLRVLFCRIGNQHLAGLWPVILTELLRLFESLVDRKVPDKSDLLQLILSACKFLDLTLVLQTEDFQIHEWMFVTDTVDAIYPPDAWLPQAIMDRLGEILSDPQHGSTSPTVPAIFATPVSASSTATPTDLSLTRGSARRPLLAARRLTSISELEPFFATVSLTAYESIYNSGNKVDWKAVESLLERDLFEGSG